MKKHLKILTLTALLFLMIIISSGCWNSRELNGFSIVLATGVDKSKEEGQVDLTVQIAKTGSSSSKKSSSSEEKSYLNLKLTGDSIFTIFRDFSQVNDRDLFIAQNQEIIFGQDLAKQGLIPYVDFFARDHEARMDTFVMVSTTTANEILNLDPTMEKTIAVELNAMIELQKNQTSYSQQVELMEFIQKIESKTTSALATLVSTKEQEGKKVLFLEGMAVFKKDKMVGNLNKEETRGYSWITNKIKGGLLDIETEKGNATLEIKSAKCKTNVEITKENKLKVELTINETGTIGELSGFKGLKVTEIVELLEKEGAKAIENEVQASISKAKELNADYFGFAEMFIKKYAKKFDDFKKYWDQDFQQVEVSVKVETTILGSGRISDLNLLTKED